MADEKFFCPTGAKYELLSEQCIECEFGDNKCKEVREEEKDKKDKKEDKVDVDVVMTKVRNEFSVQEERLKTYKGCMGLLNSLLDQYSSNNARKRKGWKERKVQIKPELKVIFKLHDNEAKLDFIIDCSEYVFFGVK